MAHTALTDAHRDTYRQNLVSALDTAETALRERRETAIDDDLIDLINLYPDETADDTPMTEYLAEERAFTVDDFVRSYVDEHSDTLFVPELLDYIEQATAEYYHLLDGYDPVEISETTGLPVHNTESFRNNGTTHLRKDALRFDAERERTQSTLKEYAMQKGHYDDVSWMMDDDVGWYLGTKRDAVETAQHDLFDGTVPTAPREQLERAEQLKGIERFEPFARGEKHLDVVAGDNDTLFFKLQMADYSVPKDDSLLFYGIGGHQTDDRPFLSFRKLPIREREDGYRIGSDLADMMDEAFDWPPEKVLEQFNQLEERGVTNGDSITTTTVEMTRVGPYYTPMTELPPEPDAAVDMAKDRYMTDRIVTHPDAPEYESFGSFLEDHPDVAADIAAFDAMDDVKEQYPATYVTVQLGEVLRDNPDTSVLCVERSRAVSDGDPATDPVEATELIFAAPDDDQYMLDPDGMYGVTSVAADIEDRIDDEIVTDNGRVTTTVLPVDDYTPIHDIDSMHTDTDDAAVAGGGEQ